MSNKFQIDIPKPCHENWNNMTPVEQGRFCNSCQKSVVDFTGMGDQQLIAYFKKPATGSVCGRFDDDQLKRDLTIPGKRMPWLKYFLQLLVPTFLFACKAKSQGEPRIMGDTVLTDIKKAIKDENVNSIGLKNELKKIKGKITDENGLAIPGATIIIKGASRGTQTDSNGNYEIDITNAGSNAILLFSAIGFMTSETPVNTIKQNVNYTLKMVPMMMGEVVVTGRCYREKKKSKRSN